MSWRDYLRKAEILLDEAEKDLTFGCFNKAVSAYWFAIEALIRSILLKHRRRIYEREGRLISEFRKFLLEVKPEYVVLINDINSIYAMRKIADHKSKIIEKERAKKISTKAKYIFSRLLLLVKF